MSTGNNRGYFLRAIDENNAPLPAGRYLEVFETNERGKPEGDPVVSCFVADCETDEEAVACLLNEFLHPFGAAWESPEQYGKELDAVKWLAEFYGVLTEKEKAEDALFDMIESAPDSCAQWELALWLVSLLPPEAVKDLAARREKTEGGSK